MSSIRSASSMTSIRELIELEGAALEQVLEATGRGDHDVGAGGLLGLLLEPTPP
jgi:hypothetical protein